MTRKELFSLIIILITAAILRFYNLMHDAPYFFNPDERNMANAITQLRLPAKLDQIPICLISQIGLIGSKTENCNLNPHFFAYGQFPLYLAYTSDQIFRSLISPIGYISQIGKIEPTTHNQPLTTTFPSAIFWLRFWSALSSVLTALLVYNISKFLIHNSKFSILAAIMAAFTPGLIQSAHFGTTESLLTFFFMASVYFSLKLLHDLSLRAPTKSGRGNLLLDCFVASAPRNDILLLSLTIGLAIGSKLTGLFFLIPPFISLTVQIIKLLKKNQREIFIGLFENLIIGLFILIGSILISILSSPYNLIDSADFKSAVFGYESDVAMGRYEAFYTRQFVNTTPIIFQAEKIFPYVLGLPIFVLGTWGFLLILIEIILCVSRGLFKIKQFSNDTMIQKKHCNIATLLIVSFLIYIIPNAFLFAKWTRFMTPILPFFSIFSVYTVYRIYQLLEIYIEKIQKSKVKSKNYNSKLKIFQVGSFCTLHFAFCILAILPGIAFVSIYTHQDSRITASRWIYDNIPNNSYILSETANVADIPLGGIFKTSPSPSPLRRGNEKGEVLNNNYQVISFDFYHLDENPILFTELISHLEKADYILIPSRRIFANYMRLPKQYPLITKYYQLLFSGALGYEKVAQISSYPHLGFGIWDLGFDDEQSEETYTVFDHPVIRIYRKTKPLTKDEYMTLFETVALRVRPLTHLRSDPE